LSVTAAPPTISGISPIQAPVGVTLTINGSNFGSSGSVTFANGVNAPNPIWSNNSIQVSVPQGAVTGGVFVTTGGQSSPPYGFTIGPLTLNLVSSVTYTTNVPSGSLTQVVYGTGDYDTYTPDPNTGRLRQYQFTVGSTPQTNTGTLTWNSNGTLQQLQVVDQFNAAASGTCQYTYDDVAGGPLKPGVGLSGMSRVDRNDVPTQRG
jgi:hypothetical protein